MPGKYPTDRKLAEALIAFRTEHNLTNTKLGRMLDVSATFLSKYLNDKLDRDPKDFDNRAWDTLRAIEQRLLLADELFDTSVTRGMHGRINYIRDTADFGLLHGPAGIGKSSAALLYVERNPSSIYIELNARIRTAKKLESALFHAINSRDWKGNSSRTDFITNYLSGSQRVIIIDNFQRLDSDGREYTFDLHDRTDCPVVGIGNPEVLDKIQGNDQHASRLGLCAGFTLGGDEVSRIAQRVAAQFSDATTAEDIADLCAVIAKHDGHLRAVRKQVVLAEVLRKTQPALKDDPRKAMFAAHRELVRNYTLPA